MSVPPSVSSTYRSSALQESHKLQRAALSADFSAEERAQLLAVAPLLERLAERL
jgi:hypothetical protein